MKNTIALIVVVFILFGGILTFIADSASDSIGGSLLFGFALIFIMAIIASKLETKSTKK